MKKVSSFPKNNRRDAALIFVSYVEKVLENYRQRCLHFDDVLSDVVEHFRTKQKVHAAELDAASDGRKRAESTVEGVEAAFKLPNAESQILRIRSIVIAFKSEVDEFKESCEGVKKK